MRVPRAMPVLLLGLASLWVATAAPAQESRLEDRTDGKADAKENSGKSAKPGKSALAGKRVIWNLDGGVFFATDGHLPNGSCFRLQGQMVAPEFFTGLRRVDTEDGSSYLSHNKAVTEYPDQVEIVLHLLDYPCSPDLKETAVRPPITREMMGQLRLNFFWKEGLHMSPVQDSRRVGASIRRIGSYATGPAADQELAPRFEWNYAFTVNAENIPLTEDLVLVIENEEHKICARVAARL